MPPVYRFIEIIVYSLLNFLPFLVLALYPFRHSLRFSRGVTGILIGLLSFRCCSVHGSALFPGIMPQSPVRSARHCMPLSIFLP